MARAWSKAAWTRLATSLRLAAHRTLRSLPLGFSGRSAEELAPGKTVRKVRSGSCFWGPEGPS
eukprot:7866681-Alexandrium_andersonii.AAC.1